MKLINILPVRNEACFLGCTARALLEWCDEIVALNHASTDQTPDILREIQRETRTWLTDANGDLTGEYRDRVTILEEPNPQWNEMDHRQRLLETARQRGATHIATLDADEILTGDMPGSIRATIESLRQGEFAGIPMKNLHRSLTRYRSDRSVWGSYRAGTMIAFADHPRLNWRPEKGYQHHHRSPNGSRQAWIIQCAGGILHLQFANWARLVAKHALYKVTERVRWPAKSVQEIDRMYSMALDETGLETTECPAVWWDRYADLMRHLDLEAEPWQAAEARRIVAQHGAAMFADLDLFGVVEAPAVAA